MQVIGSWPLILKTKTHIEGAITPNNARCPCLIEHQTYCDTKLKNNGEKKSPMIEEINHS